ncbi:glycosyltransferase family 2 protein [Caballeronia sp. dw_19]|uniref:glycosyltransferase family 2 protein n=1 Tax=Caballeronia sp. dw_19 TaxID=2719791 RepID=UPI00210736DB|nr:glycosyltransferase family 2 protein [Caballeronia sp. dw_19]
MIEIVGHHGRDTFPFMIDAGRLCKRLIRIEHMGTVRFRFDAVAPSIVHFVLARVSQRFATSRMHKRLLLTDPAYRVTTQRGSVPLALPELWHRYCDAFDQRSESALYANWVREFDTTNDADRTAIQLAIGQATQPPTLSIVMPVYRPNPAWLRAAIESVRAQSYPHWELCIADDGSGEPAVHDLLESFRAGDARIKVAYRRDNGGISAASNTALALATGTWIALLDQDDLLAEHAIFWVAHAISEMPHARLVYSDEDKVDDSGARSDPYFKSDWNPDLFYSHNMICHLGVYERALVAEVGGFRPDYDGAQDYDLALRCIERLPASSIHHIPRVLYHWRKHDGSTASDMGAKPYAVDAGRRALEDHFGRRQITARVEPDGGAYRVRYALPAEAPLVSLLIPTRNQVALLRRCVESIMARTRYTNYEIVIVNNGSDEPSALRYLRDLAAHDRVRVLDDPREFNYSRLNNSAAREARGTILGLINNDIEVINEDWLDEMVSHAVRPEIGAVGARLWYGDETIQHAGVVLGIHDVAGHVHRFLPRGQRGPRDRASVVQSFSAVTGACLVVRKALYDEVGGLNEADLAVTCNDVDFCLRLRDAGYRNIWTPYAELFHHESASRGFDDVREKIERSMRETAYMHNTWGELLRNDPAYNPNLSLDAEDFGYAWPPRIPSARDALARDHT